MAARTSPLSELVRVTLITDVLLNNAGTILGPNLQSIPACIEEKVNLGGNSVADNNEKTKERTGNNKEREYHLDYQKD